MGLPSDQYRNQQTAAVHIINMKLQSTEDDPKPWATHWLSVEPLHTGVNGLSQPCSCNIETRSEDEPLAYIWLFCCPCKRNSVFYFSAGRPTASHMWKYNMGAQNSTSVWAQEWLSRHSQHSLFIFIDFSVILWSISMNSSSWEKTLANHFITGDRSLCCCAFKMAAIPHASGTVFSHIPWYGASVSLFYGIVMTASVGTAILTSPVKHNWAGAQGIVQCFQQSLSEQAHLLLGLPMSIFCRALQDRGAPPSVFLPFYQWREETLFALTL